jgi:hypothetical protein
MEQAIPGMIAYFAVSFSVAAAHIYEHHVRQWR